MISDIYTATLRRRAIQEFIATNRRAPNEAEARQALADKLDRYPTVDEVGLSGFDIVRPQWQSESSVESEMLNRNALFDDGIAMNARLNDLEVLLEDSFRGFYATVARLDSALAKQEARVDKLLLLNSNVDVFAYGVEETFDSADKVDWSQTNASVENGYVLLGRGGLNVLDLDKAKISVTAISDGTVLSYGASSNVNSLKQDDGNLYEFMVYTAEQLTRVTCVVDLDLDGPNYVQQLELTGLPIEGNKHCYVTLAYSLDGSTYTLLEPVERALRPETVFDVGLDGVRKLQLRMSKNAADAASNSNFVSIFSIDSLKVYVDGYTQTKESELVCGPYSIQDPEGRDIFYTKATLGCCTVEPEGTAISWFLSTDGSNWIPVDPSKKALASFSSGNGGASQAVGYINTSADARTLVDQVSVLRNLNFSNEAVLNAYVDNSFIDKVPTRSMVLKRNVNSAPEDSYDSPPGWVFDSVTQRYSTTMYVSESSGRYIDFGPNGAYIEGQLVTGRTFIPEGYTRISTDDSNWYIVAGSPTTAEELKNLDPLYPYNHRYLVEGYAYRSGFQGARVYNGVTDYFGLLLSFLPLEEFSRLDSSDQRFYRVFTLEPGTNGNLYLKVKVDKTNVSWQNEYISADWTVQNGPTNQIWVKAILSSQEESNTPIIEDFNIRVI